MGHDVILRIKVINEVSHVLEGITVDTINTMAHAAYDAYGDAADWKNFRGDMMPCWDDLPANIRAYWREATKKTIVGVLPCILDAKVEP